MRRLEVPEHLDGDLSDRVTLEGNLRDLVRINRLFGGARLSVDAVRSLVEAADKPRAPGVLGILDVGTGAADIPLALVAARGPWRSIHVTATDARPQILEAAARLRPQLARSTDIALAIADGRSLPYDDAAFDVAHASLVLHHLSRDDAVAFLGELRRVARLGVVVNDLARNRRSWIGAWLILHALTRNAWTRHDGVLSVRRAWTLDEARRLVHDAGLRPIRVGLGIAGHRWAIAAVPLGQTSPA
jgi:ubiquinone/menaquinone biosynthesis C-methylase UbiE